MMVVAMIGLISAAVTSWLPDASERETQPPPGPERPSLRDADCGNTRALMQKIFHIVRGQMIEIKIRNRG